MNNFFITIVGVCQCNEGYTEDDCSVNTRKPPDVFGISEESLCDVIKRPCSSVSLFGTGFYHSDSVMCQIVQAKVRKKARNHLLFFCIKDNLVLIVGIYRILPKGVGDFPILYFFRCLIIFLTVNTFRIVLFTFHRAVSRNFVIH